MVIDKSLHLLLAFVAARSAGVADDIALLERLRADVGGVVGHAELTAAAMRTKELGRELRKFAYRVEVATGVWRQTPQEALRERFAEEPPP